MKAIRWTRRRALVRKNFVNKKDSDKMPPPGIAPGLPAPQAGVLLLYYSGGWRIRVSIPVLNLAKVVCYHVQQSPNASTGTRTRILTLEGLNTTLVLWTQDACSNWVSALRRPLIKKRKKKRFFRHQPDSNRRGQSPPDFESGALTTRP